MPLISKPERFTDKCFALGTDPTTFSKKSYLKKIYILGHCHDLYSLFTLIISFFFRNTASDTWNSNFEIFMRHEIKSKKPTIS